MTQNDRVVQVIFGQKGSPQDCTYTQGSKETGCKSLPSDTLGLTNAGQSDGIGSSRDQFHSIKHLVLLLPIQEVGRSGPAPSLAPFRHGLEDRYPAVSIFIRKRPEHDGTNDTEDGRVGTDSQGEGEHCHDREAGALG